MAVSSSVELVRADGLGRLTTEAAPAMGAQVQAAWGAVDQPLLPIAMAPQGLQLSQRVGAMARQPGYSTGHWSVQDRAA